MIRRPRNLAVAQAAALALATLATVALPSGPVAAAGVSATFIPDLTFPPAPAFHRPDGSPCTIFSCRPRVKKPAPAVRKAGS